MASSDPTGTVPATTAAALRVLRHRFGEESFHRDDAVEVLYEFNLTDSAFDIEDPVASHLQDCTRPDADAHVQVLLDNGYLYAVEDDLRITPE